METFLLTNISTLDAVLILCITFEEVFNLIAAISIDTRQLIFDLLFPPRFFTFFTNPVQ